VNKLKEIFYSMNMASYRTKTEKVETTVKNADGKDETVTTTILYIYVKLTSMTYEQAAIQYGFTEYQNDILEELMSPSYYLLFANLMGADIYGDANLVDIISGLPSGKMGSEVLKVALTRLGYPYSKMDCSAFTRWSISQVDPELGKKMSNAAGQAKWCYDNGYMVGRSELQPGDLIFWKKTGCGGCGRWNEIHHVGFYLGDGKVLDSSSSKGRVVIRNIWDNSSWPIFGFARPYKY